jgi:hypothetical protein
MHQFLCKSLGGKITPLKDDKNNLLHKLLNSYEKLNMNFKVTIEPVTKNINKSQESLYKAFILTAANHFGNSYNEMEEILKRFHPQDMFEIGLHVPVSKWNTEQLDNFINQANALLLEADSDYKF